MKIKFPHFKMFKGNKSLRKKERKIIAKTTLQEIKFHIKKKGEFHIMNFLDKRKFDIMDS